MSSFRSVVVLSSALSLAAGPSFALQATETKPAAAEASAPRSASDKGEVKKCEPHGVKKTICARCKPKLAATFKSKGDWCSEHERPESQCAICKPELKKEGVKP